jgi:DNA invertase Pin-like site-specific DNA recombinase
VTAAIYARKSTDQNGVSEDQKSVTRQIELARAFAASKGWTVTDAHVYSDDGISGAEFQNRPGYMRLLNALKPLAPFDVLIVSELSRLGREVLETGYTMKLLSQAGVRVYSYDGREHVLDRAVDKFMIAATTFAADMEREQSSVRTTDAMFRKASRGHVCGGACYGYRNVDVPGPDGRRSHVDRQVYEPEAAIVRRIFALSAAGHGFKAITKRLNAEGVAAPRPQRGRPWAWAASSVRAVLYRESYRGVNVYGLTRQTNRWGQRTCEKRPESEVVRASTPHWRIVTDAEWDAAHRRLGAAATVYRRGTNGQMWGRPPSGVASRYLLSGRLRCACCGASMTVRSRAHGKKRFYYFVCASYDTRGRSVCANSLLLPMVAADDEIIGKVSSLLDPEIVEGAIADAVAALRAGNGGQEDRREALRREIEAIGTEQRRLVEALAKGGEMVMLTQALGEREQRRALLQRELAAFGAREQLSSFDSSAVARELGRRVEEWRGLVQRNTPIARQVLDRLLRDRIAWTPRRDEGVYEYAGRLHFDGLLTGIVAIEAKKRRGIEPMLLTEGGTSPSGSERLWGREVRRLIRLAA